MFLALNFKSFMLSAILDFIAAISIDCVRISDNLYCVRISIAKHFENDKKCSRKVQLFKIKHLKFRAKNVCHIR